MVSSRASTVDEFLRQLPEDRRRAISKVREVVRENLPSGYKEVMAFGMIVWEIPLDRYPDTYNGKPLCYAGLAAQKNHNALYLMSAYSNPAQKRQLVDGFRKAGKKMDMGQSCLRFRDLEELPLDVIAAVIASTPPQEMIRQYEAARKKTAKKSGRGKRFVAASKTRKKK